MDILVFLVQIGYLKLWFLWEKSHWQLLIQYNSEDDIKMKIHLKFAYSPIRMKKPWQSKKKQVLLFFLRLV